MEVVKNRIILVVEDDAALHYSLSVKLSKAGFTVLSASDGLEGLEAALAHKPDLILLDILMERMDGFTMLEKLRQDPWGKDVHVIILTNLAEEETQKLAQKYNVDSSLVKTNHSLEEVIDLIRSILDKK